MTQVIPYNDRLRAGVTALQESIAAEFGAEVFPAGPVDMGELGRLPGRKYWAATGAAGVTGTAGVILCGDYATLKSMFVHSSARGSGAAAALLAATIAYAIDNGCGAMYLGTMERFKAAHRFYEKHGFACISEEELPPEFPANSVDTVFYMKKL